ncbi:MAG TPA: PKD domain-containing protein, partial [Roseateles sp.]
MRSLQRTILIGTAALAAALQVHAAPVNLTLAEYAFHIDGTVHDYPAGSPPGAGPASVNLAGFDTGTGVGSIFIRLSGAGSHHVGLFVDHEIDESINTFFNEYGAAAGAPTAGQSWEIDEPGFRPVNPGDIFTNFSTALLDGSNGVPSTAADDVAMAMAWDFLLNPGESALINFHLSETAPGSGFHLVQTDPDSQLNVYLWSSLSIQQDNELPEPATLTLVGLALLGAAVRRPLRILPSRRAAALRVHRLNGSRSRMLTALPALMVAGLGLPSAHAAAPVVKTVPWVAGNPLIPHTTFPARSIRLKGTADAQGVQLQYTWDFGDGSTPATGTVSNKDVIEGSHVYTGPVGQIWTARLSVTNTSTGESASRAYYVEMKARSLEAEANVAIDEGLWYLHKTMNRMSAACSGLDCGAWNAGGYAASGFHGVTAANANAFM